MMTKEQLYATDKHEETNILKQEIEKSERYGGPIEASELRPVDPVQGKGNRHTRRKRAAISRAYMKRR